MTNGELYNILYRLVKNEKDRGALYHYLKSIGNTEQLNTINKSTIIDAINEVLLNQGELSQLTIEDALNLVDAINKLNAKTGDLDDLQTTTKEDLVSAINELKDKLNYSISNTIPLTGMVADIIYNLGNITEDPNITLQASTELNKDHEYILIFNIGATAPDTITFPEDVIFTNIPSWDINYHYEVNIKWDNINQLYYALVQSWEIEED